MTSTPRRAAVASLVGTTIEWFDFFIYSQAAALVFGALFFPSVEDHAARLASFATLGVAFLARPVGAVVFGHLGDRLGRRATLIVTLTTMGVATGLIGFLPTYAQIGIWAPILLIVLRLAQGVAVGGEWGGAVLLSVEHAPKKRVRLYGSAPQIGSPLALVLSTGVGSVVATMPEEQLLAWGWRIPFLASFVLIGIGLAIRLGVTEPSAFRSLKQSGDTARVPLGELLRAWKARLAAGIGLQASVNVVFYVISVFFLSYATTSIGFAKSTALLLVMIAAAVDVAALPCFAALSDRIGPRRVFAAGAVFTAVFAYPFFLVVNTGNPVLVGVALTVAMVLGHATTYAVVSSLIADLFGTRVRYSGTAVSNALGALVWSAPTPFVAEAVVGTGGRWWPLALIVVGVAVVSLVAVALLPRRGELDEQHAAPSESHAAAARTVTT